MSLLGSASLISGNLVFLAAAAVLAIAILFFASRHTWLTAYGPEQARLRFWTAICLVLLCLLSAAAIVFNLLFS